MANKYDMSRSIPHHPRYICIRVETKYVYVANEGDEGTTHTYTCIHTRTTPVYSYDHRCQAPARYMKTETRSRRNMVWKEKGYGKPRKKKQRGEGRYEGYPPPATPTQLAHALSIGVAQGMTTRGCTRYGKYVTAQRKKTRREYDNPPPSTPTHPLHLPRPLYRGNTQGTTKRYVIEDATGTRRIKKRSKA